MATMAQPNDEPGGEQSTGALARARSRIRFLLHDLSTPRGRFLNFAILSSILVVCIVFVLRTYPLPAPLERVLQAVEWLIIGLFIVEYLLRLWVAEHKVKHFLSIYSLIDLVAIAPFFFIDASLQSLRIFRVLRIMRLIRFLDGPHFFFGTIRRTQLIILRIVFILISIIFVSAALIFQAEHEANPEDFRTFFDGIYFAVVTVTTVGYGDITPTSTYGRVVTVLVILGGIVLLPWQIKNLIQSWIADTNLYGQPCKGCGLGWHDTDAIFCKRCGTRLAREATRPEVHIR